MNRRSFFALFGAALITPRIPTTNTEAILRKMAWIKRHVFTAPPIAHWLPISPAMLEDANRFLSLPEAARLLGLTERRVSQLAVGGELAYEPTVGGQFLFHRRDLTVRDLLR